MKKLFLLLLFVSIIIPALCQTHWVTKELPNNIWVKFPNVPTYKLIDKIGNYTAKSENCLFIASVCYDAVPHYGEFLKLPENQKEKIIEVLLDNVVNGLLIQASKKGTSFKKISIGNYSGRELNYEIINPISGNNTVNYCKLFYCLGKVYILQTYSYKDDTDCPNEMSIFLKSITTK